MSLSVSIGRALRPGPAIGTAVCGGGVAGEHAFSERQHGGGVGPPCLHAADAAEQRARDRRRYLLADINTLASMQH